MTQLWTILDGAGEVVQPCCATPDAGASPEACGEPWEAGYQAIALAEAPDLHRMVWAGDQWELSPQIAHDMQWQAAKDFSDARALSDFVLPGVGPIQTDEKSLTAIRLLVEEARDRIAEGDAGWSTKFLNKDNVEVPVTAPEILAINKAVRAFFAAVYDRRQAHRAALKAALEAGATAEQILAIDITAGYPA